MAIMNISERELKNMVTDLKNYEVSFEITDETIIDYIVDNVAIEFEEKDIDSFNDYLMRGCENPYYEMDCLDDELVGAGFSPTDIINALDSNFSLADEYFRIDDYDCICSCDGDEIMTEMEDDDSFVREFIRDKLLEDFKSQYKNEIKKANEILEKEEKEGE